MQELNGARHDLLLVNCLTVEHLDEVFQDLHGVFVEV